MTQIHIDLANFDDHDDAASIVEIVDSYAREPQGGGHPLPEAVCQQMVAGLKATPGAFVLLARNADQAVGAAVCFRGFSTFAGRPLVNVHDLSVIQQCRGQGIGTRLLQAVEEYARGLGCCKVTLEVREINPQAERLYRRLGYGDPSGYATRFLDKPLP